MREYVSKTFFQIGTEIPRYFRLRRVSFGQGFALVRTRVKKIPNYMWEPATEPERAGINKAVKALELEAAEYRAVGRKDAADAIRQIAWKLRCVADGETWAPVFCWPDDRQKRA
jgi:hypothetical protein